MNHEALILKHFNKTLSKDEETVFSNLLETDADFKTLFNEHENMHVAFKLNEKQSLKNHLNNFDSNTHSVKKKLNQKIIVLATACCLLIGAFYFLNNSSSNIYDTYFDVYPNVLEPVVRGEQSTNSDAFMSYENENYSDAEAHFKEVLKKNVNPNIEFYYAMSLLNQDKFDDAQNVLEALKTKTHEFLPEVYWYSALIAVKNNDIKQAKKELDLLKLTNSDFKKEDIKSLLKVFE